MIVASAGGVEEDFVKCLADTYLGDFDLDGKALRKQGLNRIGNMLVPNENYCKFEDWITPIFDQMLIEQKESVIFIYLFQFFFFFCLLFKKQKLFLLGYYLDPFNNDCKIRKRD